MRTIKEASLQPGSNWVLQLKLIDKQIFTIRKRDGTRVLLILFCADQDGDCVELKSWSDKKVYTVYRKFDIDDSLKVSGSGNLQPPNPNYSMAKSEVYSSWYAEPINNFQPRKFIPCISNIERYFNLNKKLASVVGTFHEFIKGPARLSGTRITVQGYYVKLVDDSGNLYQVLVWHTKRIERSKFPLFHSKPGDIILIPYAREQEKWFREQQYQNGVDLYTLTSTYPPVVNSECIQFKHVHALESAYDSLPNGRPKPFYAPPEPMQEKIIF